MQMYTDGISSDGISSMENYTDGISSMEMCVPRRSKNFLLARILTGQYLQAKLPSTAIRGVHDSLNMKHDPQNSASEWLYGYLHQN